MGGHPWGGKERVREKYVQGQKRMSWMKRDNNEQGKMIK